VVEIDLFILYCAKAAAVQTVP